MAGVLVSDWDVVEEALVRAAEHPPLEALSRLRERMVELERQLDKFKNDTPWPGEGKHGEWEGPRHA